MSQKVRNVVIIALVLVAVAGVFVLRGPAGTAEKEKTAVQTALPVVMILQSQSCPACKQMSIVLKEFSGKYGAQVRTEEVDIMQNPDLAREFKVRYIPMLVFKDGQGKVLGTHVGYLPLDAFMKKLKEVGITVNEG